MKQTSNHRKLNDPQVVFGHLIRRLRNERGLSQEALAFESGLSRGFIAYIELGHRKPTVVALLQLARGLVMMPSEIIALLERELGLAMPEQSVKELSRQDEVR